MKFLYPLFLLALLATASLRAQTGVPAAAAMDTPAPAPGSTVITSDELRMDQASHIAVFTGSVVATGTNFTMKCQEMTVNFDKAGKVDTILSKGDVVVEQPGRISHSGQVEYFRDDDKFVLTDQPVIVDNKNRISAPQITIYRGKQSLYTSGGKSTLVIPEMNSSTTPAATDKK
jgi:lipopolysaccharide transport protein LptA